MPLYGPHKPDTFLRERQAFQSLQILGVEKCTALINQLFGTGELCFQRIRPLASELSHLDMQFLSDFEQGKNTGEIGKILKALQTLGLEIVVQPSGVGPGYTDQNSLSKKTAPKASGCLQAKSSSTLLKSKSKR